MKRILPFIVILFSFVEAFPQTSVSGTIGTTRTWTLAGSPYVVTSNLTVSSGVTLTIDQDVVVKFNDNISMIVNGTVNATGVTFTASNASPVAGTIGTFRIGTTSGSVNGAGTFTNCQFLYFQSVKLERGSASFTGCSFSNFSLQGIESYGNGNLTINGGTMSSIGKGGDYQMLSLYGSSTNTISNFTITGDNNSNEAGVADAAAASFSNVTIQSSTGNALWLATTGAVSVTDCNFENTNYPIYLYQQSVPLTFSGTNDFTGNKYDAVYCGFIYITGSTTLNNPGIPYWFYSSMEVTSTGSLTVASGNIIKQNPGTALTIKGILHAEAAVGEKIYFTTVYDDNLGGDTNDDANNTAPTSGRWSGIHFTNESNDAQSILRRAEIRWTAYYGALNLTDASCTIDSSEFRNCTYGAVFNSDSNPTFTNNIIASSESTPIAMSFEADPVFSNNQFSTSDNQYDAIGLLGGTLTANASIVKRDFTDIPNVTYVMLNTVTVPSGKTLSIDPGVVIKSLSGYSVVVNGKLLVNGTAEDKVVFTSVNDDNFGNPLDTRNDGTNQTPGIGHFGGIYFGETSDPASAISHAAIRFASYTQAYYSSSYAAAICISNSSPTISNTEVFQATNGFDIRGLSSPLITGSKIANTTGAPFRIAIQATPQFSGNTFQSVGWRAIAVLPEIVNYTGTLSKRNIDGLFDNVTYVITDLTIGAGAMVTLDSGLVVKFASYKGITVEGALKINGKPGSRITFTALADDNAGASLNPTDNDTEGNGNATTPVNAPWNTIRFEAGSNDAGSFVQYADFYYGGVYESPVSWASASANMNNVNIKFAKNYGLWFSGNSAPAVSNVFIQSATYDPLAMSFFSNPVFTNITFDANGSNGIRLIDTGLGANATLHKRDIAGITNIAYITGGFLVHSGAELTIDPGVVIKMSGGSIGVDDGAILAVGTTGEKIIFTSINDDSRGGDTNNNGNATPPAAGNWGGIDTRASSKQTIFKYCEFRYGSGGHYSRGYYDGTGYAGFVRSDDNNMIVENCVIQFTNNIAFGAYGTSTASFINNSIQNVTYEPIAMHMFANPTMSGNTLENVGRVAIRLRPETFSQSNTFVFRSFAGYDSITYVIPSAFKIASGTTITIPAGMHFKLSDTFFEVDGKLVVNGTAENPVVFTTLSDDTYGRPQDTEQNGAQYIYKYSRVLQFNNISDDNSVVDHAIMRYATYDVTLTSASPTITNSLFEYSDFGISMSGISQPVIENNKFKDLVRTPFSTSLVSYPASTANNTMEGTTWKGILVNEETLTQDTTLVKRSFGGINNIPYIFSDYTIGPGVTLSVDPGVILKFAAKWYYPYTAGMYVSGALHADGEPDATGTIVFTSIEDDFYGGDTNANGPLNALTGNSWSGVTFNNESSDVLSILDHVIIRRSNSFGLTLNSASPTISNSSFRSNSNYGMYLTGASNPVLTANDFLDNGIAYYGTPAAINNTGSFNVNATGSWWGHNSGPYHATTNPTGKGSSVSNNVIYNPWATDLSLNPVTGDVSLNGTISAYDAALALQSVVALITLDARQVISGDVTGDNSVSAMDASYILQYSTGIITNFPAESTEKRVNTAIAGSEVRVMLQDGQFERMDQILEIPLAITNVGNLYALELSIRLDDELELVDIQKGQLDLNYIHHYNSAEKILRIAFASAEAVHEDGLLAVLKVRAATPVFSKNSLTIDIATAKGNATSVEGKARPAHIGLTRELESEMATAFKVFPNPASEFIDVSIKPSYEGLVRIEMLDAAGKPIVRQSYHKAKGFESHRVSFRAGQGIYLLKIVTSEGVITSKVVVGE
jgi:parallel beta-helix repeat protein